MKRFIFLLMMTICMGVANASSSYQASHEVTNNVQIVQPPGGYEFEFVAPNVEYCFYQENNIQDVFSYVVISNSMVSNEVIDYLDQFRLCRYSCDAGLKQSKTLIPQKSVTSLNYFAGNYNYTKHRYRCSHLRCSDFVLYT